MNKKYTFPIILFSVISLFISCDDDSSSPSNYMILNEVEFITSFPQTFSLNDKIEPEIDIIGIKSFIIYDSLLILSTVDREGLWSFISLPDYNYIGKLLKQGDGPFEFTQSPDVSYNTNIFKEKDILFANIYDSQKGRLLKLNIDESLTTGDLHISSINESLPHFLFNSVVIDSTSIFCKKFNDNYTQQIRYITNHCSGEIIIPPILQKLNEASIKTGEDINILSTITKMNMDNKRFVEMPIGLNYINTYSLDGTFSKTICIGDKLDNIHKIQNKKIWNRIYTYSDVRIFSDFWGVVQIDEDEKTFQTGRKKRPSILLFNWEGEPLANLELSHFITSFDIDLKNGTLYTLDVHSDEFHKYNISYILEKLK
ncbi:MAG: TolB-like 6-bladed beta-propeller domain-containing protein [Tannerellaceae bacterium]|nr:TolB-like 6-bladed beta-propeller domain-containing protein [Tannerellaceae bacterium]